MQHDPPLPHSGQAFAAFLHAEGMRDEAEFLAIRRVLVDQILTMMRQEGLSKSRMAQRLRVGLPALRRFCDVKNDAVNLYMLQRVATGLGQKVRLSLTRESTQA